MKTFPSFNKLMSRLGWVRKSEADMWRQMSSNDSALAAALVDELRKMQEENDRLYEELDFLQDKILHVCPDFIRDEVMSSALHTETTPKTRNRIPQKP